MLKIKELRRAKNMTIEELANKSGVSKRMISTYETGESNITLQKMQQIATSLEVSISELIGESSGPPQEVSNNTSNHQESFVEYLKTEIKTLRKELNSTKEELARAREFIAEHQGIEKFDKEK